MKQAHEITRPKRILRAAAGVVALVALSAAALSPPAAAVEADAPPNVVSILVDDQTLEQMRVMTATQAFFEENGTIFDNFVTSLPVCCPSRATFLTGQYALHHGVIDNGPPNGGYEAFDDSDTLPVWLQEAGYRTTFMGKYLNGYHTLDIPPGWTDWQGMLNNKYYGFSVNDNGTKIIYGTDPSEYQTDVLTESALTSIDESVAQGDPFFLWVSTHAPHNEAGELPPPAPRHEGAFADEPLPMGPGFDEADVSDKPVYIQERSRLSEAQIAEITTFYRAELETLLAVDEMVAAIVQRLTELDVLDNTVLMFSSDNGKMHGEHRLTDGKRVPYEESVRVPLMIAGPGFPAGLRIDAQAANIDLATTTIAIAGGTAGLPQDGIDLRDVVANPPAYRDRAVLLERYDRDCYEGMHSRQHTYVDYTTGEKELYDLLADPAQLQNLAGDPSVERAQADLAAQLGVLVAEGFEPCQEPPPMVQVGDITVTETRQGKASVSVPLSLNVLNHPVTVSYTLKPLTADSEDFTVKSGTVKFKKGRYIMSIPATVQSDWLSESDEVFEVVLTSVVPAIDIGRSIGTVTIRNAPAGGLPAVNAGDVVVAEGDDAIDPTVDLVYVPVTLSKRLAEPLVLDYETADGTALAGADYEAASGSVTIPAGTVSVQIPVVVINDNDDEGDQWFSVDLSTDNPLVSVVQSVGTVWLLDDDSE